MTNRIDMDIPNWWRGMTGKLVRGMALKRSPRPSGFPPEPVFDEIDACHKNTGESHPSNGMPRLRMPEWTLTSQARVHSTSKAARMKAMALIRTSRLRRESVLMTVKSD